MGKPVPRVSNRVRKTEVLQIDFFAYTATSGYELLLHLAAKAQLGVSHEYLRWETAHCLNSC